MENEEIITSAEQAFYFYNIEGVSELACSDQLVCSDYLYVE